MLSSQLPECHFIPERNMQLFQHSCPIESKGMSQDSWKIAWWLSQTADLLVCLICYGWGEAWEIHLAISWREVKSEWRGWRGGENDRAQPESRCLGQATALQAVDVAWAMKNP